VRQLYEDVWARLPPGGEREPFAFARRRAFLLESVAPGDDVLDLGCGEGDFCAVLAQAGAVPTGAEIARTAVDRARARHPGLRFDLVEPHGPLAFEDNTFDAVWASEVIEHVADTARWLSEVRRVLRPGGRLLVTTPFHGRVKNVAIALARFERHFDPTGQHLRFYTRRSLRDLLEAFGFGEVAIEAASGPPLLRESLHARARR